MSVYISEEPHAAVVASVASVASELPPAKRIKLSLSERLKKK